MNNTIFRNVRQIDDLVEIYAKNPADHFIVTDKPLTVEVAQGDVLIWSKNCKSYKRFIQDTEITDEIPENYNLQGATSVTGDHRVIPMPDSNFKMTIAKITMNVGFNQTYVHEGRHFISDKPFLVTHREHGNIALPAGEYLACVALNPTNMRAPEHIISQMQAEEQAKLDKYNAAEKIKWEQKIREDERRRQNALKIKRNVDSMDWRMLD